MVLSAGSFLWGRRGDVGESRRDSVRRVFIQGYWRSLAISGLVGGNTLGVDIIGERRF